MSEHRDTRNVTYVPELKGADPTYYDLVLILDRMHAMPWICASSLPIAILLKWGRYLKVSQDMLYVIYLLPLPISLSSSHITFLPGEPVGHPVRYLQAPK